MSDRLQRNELEGIAMLQIAIGFLDVLPIKTDDKRKLLVDADISLKL